MKPYALDILRINEWQKSVPNVNEQKGLQTILSSSIKRVLNNTEKLSIIIAELQYLAKNNQLSELNNFCTNEILGFDVSVQSKKKAQIETHRDDFNYRVQTIKLSLLDVNPNPYSPIQPEQVKYEIENNKDFLDFPFFFPYPLSQIEDLINKTDGFARIKMNIKEVIPNYKQDAPVHGYIFNSNFKNLYQNIKQKLIDIIMKIE